jgi:hypothetical protein
MNTETCIYCNAEVNRESNPYIGNDGIVPPESDEAWWARERQMHNPDCEWVNTHAHRYLP